MLRTLIALAAAGGLLAATPALAATTHAEPPHIAWSFDGPFGTYDQAQLQRGYKVYREVCASCHSMNMVAFRNLGDPGGPFYDPKYPNPNNNPVVKAIAKDFQIPDLDDTGQPDKRPGTSADYFPKPFPNELAARAANGGALPPDMSLLVKAREGGADHIHAVVTGYKTPPPGLEIPPGKYYNPYVPGDLGSFWHGKGPVPIGSLIAMPPPLKPGQVTFDDGTPSTLDQEATAVAAFLQWASDPKLEERHQDGLSVMIFLLIFSGLLYASYRLVWRDVAH
jgi:ubiquinol-cytochrome c reductase cytochrome c1 subunit